MIENLGTSQSGWEKDFSRPSSLQYFLHQRQSVRVPTGSACYGDDEDDTAPSDDEDDTAPASRLLGASCCLRSSDSTMRRLPLRTRPAVADRFDHRRDQDGDLPLLILTPLCLETGC